MRTDETHRALVIGCHGGVGRAVLSLLERTAPGRRWRERLDAVLLVDRKPPDGPVPLTGSVLLPPTTIASADDLARLIREHRVTQVIDLSSIDTVDCTLACDELGADFLCTSVEEWAVKVFRHRHVIKRGDDLLCEGTEVRTFAIRDPANPERIRSIPIPEDIKALCI